MWRSLRSVWRAVFLRRRLDDEMRQEMAGHLAQATERLKSRGLPAEEARRLARREFGNVDVLQEQGRDARGGRWLETLLADVRFGFRHFARTPGPTVIIIVLLALGIGFNSALFTFFYSFTQLPPPGITRAESLVRIRGLDRNGGPERTRGREFAYPEYLDYAAQTDLFSAVTAWTSSDVVLAKGDRPEDLQSGAATYATTNYFPVLGVRPMLGAGLPVTPDDGDAQLVAIISHALWDRFFGRAPDVIGKTIEVNDVAVTIVGVAPARFAGARVGGSQMRVWLPLNTRPLLQRSSLLGLSSSDSVFFSLAARLRPGVTSSQTTATVQAIAQRAAQQSTRWRGRNAISTDVVTLLAENYYPPSGEAPNIGSRASSLLIPVLILLIPCTNVSSLLVGLAVKRRREIAVRLALGAARKRIIRQLITESVLLALAAGLLGLFVIRVLLTLFSARVSSMQLALHWPAVAFTAGVAILTGLSFGVSPALHATRVGVGEVLKGASTAVASTRSRLQSGLVVAQIAMTQPLLLGLGVLILSLLSDLQRMPVSTFSDRIAQVSFEANLRDGMTEPEREELLRRVQERFAAVPGVESVVAQQQGDGWLRVAVHPADRIAGEDNTNGFALRTRAAPPGYFELMGFPFIRGRAFDRADQTDGRTLIIRGDLARRLWGSADPIGRRLVHADSQNTLAFVVVGVVDETVAGLSGDGDQHVFVPTIERTGSLLVRTRGAADPVTPLLRMVANAEAALLPVTSARTLASIEAGERSTFRRASGAAVGSGLIALLMCAIGLYAIVSFAVNQRTREIGIRTALGASPNQVVGTFFARGLRLSVLGLLIGLGFTAAVLRIISVTQGQAGDIRNLGIGALVAVVVVAVASLATWIPARRAARVDPLDMLRVD